MFTHSGKFSPENLKINWNIPDNKISQYCRIDIKLDSAYKWGRGWTTEESRSFHNVVDAALEKAGYRIAPSVSSWESPMLYLERDYKQSAISSIKSKIPGLYMHPMEFTGYFPEKDAKNIVRILNEECGSVCRAELNSCEKVYEVSDREYTQLIMAHSKEIASFVADSKNNAYIKYPDEAGFDFARNNRLPRLNDGCIYSSSDVDVRTVASIIIIANELGYFDREKGKDEPDDDYEAIR